jgi:hypothetical protein
MLGCFIVPIYDKKNDFEYGYKLTESAIKYAAVDDLYFVFSTAEQEKKFLDECCRRFSVTPKGILCDKDMRVCKNPVSIKKYYAIRELKDKYDYIAAIDCECVFLKKTDSGLLMDTIWKEGTYLSCNKSKTGARDVRICLDALGLGENKLLIQETENKTVTWWFNEIPVYKSDTLDDFFNWLNSEGRYSIVYNEWSCFDYLVYVIWLILCKNKHLKVYDESADCGIIEELCNPKCKKKYTKEKKLGVHWSSRLYRFPANSKIYMIFHLDRQSTLKQRIKRKMSC